MTSTEDDDGNKKYHLYEYLGEGEEEDTEDYTTRDEKDIPFNPKKMRLDDVLNTDYQVTDEELLDYEAAEASGNGEPLKLEEFKEFRNRREMQEELIKKEIAQRVGERGGTSYEATKEFKLYKIKFVRETIRKMMALYESHRRYLYRITNEGQPIEAGADNGEEAKYYTKFLYLYRGGIREMQKELRRREEELRREFSQ